jgi:Domain of unknown function (DU1801)
VQSKAETVAAYLAELPDERREAIGAVREVVLANLPDGFEEGMQYGMIGYYVPLERYPETYNGQPLGVAALASQKRHISLYLMGIYANDDGATWFRERWEAAGKRLDMGKSCVRFRRLEDVPLEVVGEGSPASRSTIHIGLRAQQEANRLGTQSAERVTRGHAPASLSRRARAVWIGSCRPVRAC